MPPSTEPGSRLGTAPGTAPEIAYIGLGANLGDLRSTLEAALGALRALPWTELIRVSSFHRSAPHEADGPDYLNAVAELSTRLEPLALLDELQRIERAHGRERRYRNAPRTLDLDLLLHGARRLDDPRLTLPHPRLHERAFVLDPLAEIAPALRLPDGTPIAERRAALRDQRIERLPG